MKKMIKDTPLPPMYNYFSLLDKNFRKQYTVSPQDFPNLVLQYMENMKSEGYTNIRYSVNQRGFIADRLETDLEYENRMSRNKESEINERNLYLKLKNKFEPETL
jgi:hypothetical protein